VTRAYVPLLLLLSAIWGASYLFIKVGVRDFEPTVLMAIRLLLAFPLLFAFLAFRTGIRRAALDVRGAWRRGLVLGSINAAIPFTLIAWGEKHIDSGVTAIANATVPIFVLVLASRFKPSERAGGMRLLGIATGLVGVGVLSGAAPNVGMWTVLGTLAVVLASFLYAIGGLFGQASTASVPGPVLAAATCFYGGLLLLPFALLQLPTHAPAWGPIASVVALSLAGTGFAQLVLFRMLRLHGASRTTLVTYLLPPFALFYGALILDEPITASAVAGLVLVLLGVALGSGTVRLLRREAVETST
jgi:drug/metabolite transporter (DMT)-like permease